MGYSTDILRHRVEILKRVQGDGDFGLNTGPVTYETLVCVPCAVTWKKGAKNLSEGALDGVDTVMFRMRWNSIVNRECFLRHEGVVYQIMSFHADRQEDTIQMTGVEIVPTT